MKILLTNDMKEFLTKNFKKLVSVGNDKYEILLKRLESDELLLSINKAEGRILLAFVENRLQNLIQVTIPTYKQRQQKSAEDLVTLKPYLDRAEEKAVSLRNLMKVIRSKL